jgi:CheY-like chemotaxis protein
MSPMSESLFVSQSLHTARVLVVDDDSITRLLLSKKLQQMGHHVVQADDGIKAFAILRSEPIDFAIVDLEMPIMDGYELLGCIRGLPRLKHLPVFVITGVQEPGSIRRALQSGATSILFKPIAWNVFDEHITHHSFLIQARAPAPSMSALAQ